jgi:concanavalin A-like lectin/glucanase superfamily protein/fibronectin type III domain protein
MNFALLSRGLRFWSALAILLLTCAQGQAQDACQALCLDNYVGGNRSFWNSGASGLGNYRFVGNRGGEFIINEAAGTARILGEIVSINDPHDRFKVEIDLSGRVQPGDAAYPPANSPKLEGDTSSYMVNGGHIDTNTWVYWTTLTGTLKGKGNWEGAIIDVVRKGPSAQYGFGANVKDELLGFSTWMDFTTLQQPSTGNTLPAAWHGDINASNARQCVAEPFPGSADDLRIMTAVDNETPDTGFGRSVDEGMGGQTLTVKVESPEGTYAGMPIIVGVNCFMTCEPYPDFYPAPYDNIYMTPGSGLSLEVFGPNGYYGPANLDATGEFAFVVPVFPFFENMSLMFQAFVVSDQASNGWLAISNGHRFDIINSSVVAGAPQNLVVANPTHDGVELSWDEVDFGPEGVERYRIYVDGVPHLEVAGTTTTATIEGLSELSNHAISVSAFSTLSYESVRSAVTNANTLADAQPPVVMIAAAMSDTEIEIDFDEPVEAACATDIGNYGLDHGATITGATLSPDGRRVTLTTSTLSTGLSYLLVINGVEDMSQARNVIAPNTQVPVTTRRVSSGLVALYEFDEGQGTTVADSSGFGSALDLNIADIAKVTWQNGGLAINQGTIIESAGAATKIASACQATNEITIEAWVLPENSTQSGPARIATFSQHTTNRNFTLGQDGDDYIARLRTSVASNNGTPNLVSSATAAVALKHLVFTRNAAGAWSLWVDGVETATGTRGGDFSNWNADWKFALGNEFTMNRAWLGELHLVAVFDQALDAAAIQTNFEAGP